MPPDPALVAEVRAWLAKAGSDLRAGEVDLAAQPPLAADAAFHAQQAVEKSLKALLTWSQIAFRKTHNLVELGEACVAIDASLEPLLRDAAELTEYAWRFRYPGDFDEPTASESDQALRIAHKVFAEITRRIGLEPAN